MKIFISWSGEHSKVIATNVYEFLKENIQATDPWISTDDIGKGQNWMNDLMLGLESSHMGIFCLTDSNLNSKWMLFEAGLVAAVSKRKINTILYNIKPENISPPLSLFNHTTFEKEDFRKLLLQINQLSKEFSENKLTDKTLDKIIDKNWDDFEKKISNEILTKKSTNKENRSDSDKIDELINISRNLQSSLLKKKAWYDVEINGKYYRKCFDGKYREIRKDDDGKFYINCKDKEWLETVEVEYTVSSDLILKVQIMLNQYGYKVKTDNIMDAESKAALINYQKENGLPVGALDYETLKSLGIK